MYLLGIVKCYSNVCVLNNHILQKNFVLKNQEQPLAIRLTCRKKSVFDSSLNSRLKNKLYCSNFLHFTVLF